MEVQEWRIGPVLKVGALLTSLGFAAIGALAMHDGLLDGTQDLDAVLVAVLMVLALITIYRMVWWPRMTLTGSEILVRNPWRRYSVAVKDVVTLNTNPSGILIGDREGATVVAWVGQKGTGASWLGLTVRADKIIEELATAVDEEHRRAGLPTPRTIRRYLPRAEE
ncbi:hypothetical protein [Amycolatopsis tucumanensis]|uniref:PH domain-containing protein n=1 Tax=Amycolatopsis tucumanensis TaxID=401106 RepID=A0ABP7HT54_9PSEU|nr:hypothetical protein [Amycolatopsis tucumanensis]MCF6422000.1 hypothetical protein [Amycolatopsis tucumanensis]